MLRKLIQILIRIKLSKIAKIKSYCNNSSMTPNKQKKSKKKSRIKQIVEMNNTVALLIKINKKPDNKITRAIESNKSRMMIKRMIDPPLLPLQIKNNLPTIQCRSTSIKGICVKWE